MTSRTDETLLRDIHDGDGQALDALFRRHHARVHDLCARLTGDATAADDLVQESFLRVMRSAGTFRGSATFTTWLYTIARNVCRDYMSRERKRALMHARALEPDEAGSDSRTDVIHRAMRELSPDAREVLVLSRFQDLPMRDVASILGCSEGAARVRVHRALLNLREIVLQMEAAYDGL